MIEKLEYDLENAISRLTVTKEGLAVTMKFIFPIPLNDTRKIRDYDLKLIIIKKTNFKNGEEIS